MKLSRAYFAGIILAIAAPHTFLQSMHNKQKNQLACTEISNETVELLKKIETTPDADLEKAKAKASGFQAKMIIGSLNSKNEIYEILNAPELNKAKNELIGFFKKSIQSDNQTCFKYTDIQESLNTLKKASDLLKSGTKIMSEIENSKVARFVPQLSSISSGIKGAERNINELLTQHHNSKT